MADDAQTPASPYGLFWGVKSSFMGYISSLSDGSITLSDGATLDEKGVVHFPFAGMHKGAEDDDSEQWIRSTGTVAFSGHFGMLAVTIRNPALRVTENSTTLLCEQEDGSYYPIVDLELPAPETTDSDFIWDGVTVTLNEKGVAYFSQYPAGTVMDPIRIHVPIAG